MRQPQEHTNDESSQAAILAFRHGERGADERLTRLLHGPVKRNVTSFLGPDAADTDDVIQDAMLETMKYLQREEGFEGDVVRLAITISRNQCRDLLRWRRRHPHANFDVLGDWISDPSNSILEELEIREQQSLLQTALSRLSKECRTLLKALFLQKVSTEVMRQRLGLGTVHAVYHRREACLRRAKKNLQDLIEGRSTLQGAAFDLDDGGVGLE